MSFEVRFAPTNSQHQSGFVSFASWDNRHLQEAIIKAFNTSPRERIVRVDIEKDGIKAYFEICNAMKE